MSNDSIVSQHFGLEPSSPKGVWKDQNFDNPQELLISIQNFAEAIDNIFNWGVQRGIVAINGGTALAQIAKLKEEVDEIEEGINENDRKKVVDGIGDSLVVMVQLARLAGVSFDEAVAEAWNSIKDRTGIMRCGVFVKQVDLDLVGDFDWVAFEKCTDANMVRDLIAKAKAWHAGGRRPEEKLRG